MKVKHYQFGTVVEVSAAKAAALVSGAAWAYVDSPEKAPDGPDAGLEEEAGTETSDEDDGPVIDIRTIRAWAMANKVEGVSERGKLSKAVIDAYLAAHAETTAE